MTLTVTVAQAQRLAAEMQQMQRTLELLTLGTPAQGRTLASVNTDDGTLTFHVAPDAG
jgi:hypothetical protein